MTHPPSFDLVLDQALEALAAGQTPAEIAAHYAEPTYPARYSADLLPLLEAAQRTAAGLAAPIPVPDLSRGRRRFLAAAAVPAIPPRRSWALVFAVVLVVLGLLFAAPRVSASALPGDVLYPLKRAVEGVQLAVTLAPAERRALAERLAQQRRQEAARLLAIRREARLDFEGRVEAVAPDRLTISGLTVLSPDAAAFHAGDLVAVQARTTRAGSLIAIRLTLLAAAPGLRAATPTASPQRPPLTATPRATNPARLTGTPSAVATRPLASPTLAPSRVTPINTEPPATRSATVTASPAATQRPPDPSATAERPTEARSTETQRPRP